VDEREAGYETGGLHVKAGSLRAARSSLLPTLSKLISGVSDVSWTNSIWLASVPLLTYGMMVARSRFLWFPLHPLGFLMCLTYPIQRLWFSTFWAGWPSAHHALRRQRHLSQGDPALPGPGAGRRRHDAGVAGHRRLAGTHRSPADARLKIESRR
jgi:hypothetical protein